jgi:hypothetical protein
MKAIIVITLALFFTVAASAQQKIAAQFPKATLAGKSSGEITVNEILKAGALSTTSSELKIVSFSFSLKDGKNVISLDNKTAKFSESTLGFVRNLQAGKTLYVENIETVKFDGVAIKLEPVKFTIK